MRLCRSAPQRAAHYAVRRAVFVDEQEMFAGDDRDERDARITTLHAIGIARRRVAGAVRLYPLDAAGCWKGDRLAVLPEARPARSARGSCASRSRPRASAAARAWSRMIQLPNVRFFERARLAARRRRGRLPRRPAPAHGDPAQPAARERLGGEVPHRPPTPRRRPGAARASRRRCRTARSQAAAREAAHASSTCSGAAASTNPKLGNVSSQRSSATPVGAREAVEVERRAAAGELEQLQQRAGDAGHRHVAGRVAEPALGDLDERLAVVAQLRRVAVVQRGEERRLVAMIPALEANAASSTSPGRAAAARSGVVATPVQKADSAGARAERQVPADDRHAEPVRRPRDPVEHALGVRRGRG